MRKPLDIACWENDIETVTTLLEAGEDPDQTDKSTGKTLLYHACQGNLVEIVSLLLKFKANPNPPPDNDTPLIRAVSNENLEITALLIEHGADVNKKDVAGNTPLSLAMTSSDNPQIIALLIQNSEHFDCLFEIRNRSCSSEILRQYVDFKKMCYANLLKLLNCLSLFSDSELFPNSEDYDDIIRSIKATIKEWHPHRHQLFPAPYQEAITTLTVLSRARITEPEPPESWSCNIS